jgi:hypothetical protein
MDDSMSTNFERLSCEKGCCLDKVKHLAEQIYRTQDDMYNMLAEENIELGNYVVDCIIPYLVARSESQDHAAQDLLLDLNQLLRGV